MEIGRHATRIPEAIGGATERSRAIAPRNAETATPFVLSSEDIVKRIIRAAAIGVVVWCAAGCAVTATVPAGESYAPPVSVAGPPVSVWLWSPWPHYEVEHRYVVEHRDRGYCRSYGHSRRHIRDDRGRRRGWYGRAS
jgi:hypothetical protein